MHANVNMVENGHDSIVFNTAANLLLVCVHTEESTIIVFIQGGGESMV